MYDARGQGCTSSVPLSVDDGRMCHPDATALIRCARAVRRPGTWLSEAVGQILSRRTEFRGRENSMGHRI